MESKPLGLKITYIKIKILKFVALFDGNKVLPQPVTVDGEQGSYVDTLVCLGSAIGSWQ